jgi:hypothetical protein
MLNPLLDRDDAPAAKRNTSNVQRRGGTIGPLRRSERLRGALDEFVSDFGFGGGNRVIRAQRIC